MTLLAESCASQVPSLALYPPGDLDYELGDAVLDWLDAVGMTLFDWQRRVLRHALARRGKRWAAYEVDLIVPRQNGKNEILIALELAAVTLLGQRLVIHSAHEAITAAKHFARFRELVNDESLSYKPEIAKLFPNTKTRGFFTSNGKEHIEFANGAVIEFRTRTRQAGRGFSSPLVVVDEAFNLPQAAVGSLQYTLRAKPNAQIWKTSSAAHATSDVLHNDRRRAKDADPDDTHLLYMEWGNEADCDPSAPETWLRSNPSLGCTAPGFGLELQTFRNEYASAKGDPLSLAEFIREVCGVPEPPLGSEPGPIAVDRWDSLIDAASTPAAGSVRLALDAPPGHGGATFSIAGKRADNLLHTEIVAHIVPRVEDAGAYRIAGKLRDKVVELALQLTQGHNTPLILPPSSPARAWKADLLAAGVPLDEMTPAEYAEACGRIANAVDEGALRHRGQPELNNAVAGLASKASGDVEAWSRRNSSSNIAPFVACTCALARVPQVADVDPASQIW